MRPRIGISRCLLGDDVRYDATNRRSRAVEEMAEHVEWVPVCPEVDVGMGVPREPIQLVAVPDGMRSAGDSVRLLGVQTREDWTERMERWAHARVRQLGAMRLGGFVLKARSPSCGPAAVLVHHQGGVPTSTGRGLFAATLSSALPGLPLIDEEALEDLTARERFLQAVRAFV